MDVVKKYRELGIPLDGIIQDWQYWGNNYLWNAMEFLNPGFYDPKKMIDDVHGLNAHMIISIWSSFGPQTKPFKELEKKGALLDFITWPESGSEKWPPNPDYPSGVKVYDAYNPAAERLGQTGRLCQWHCGARAPGVRCGPDWLGLHRVLVGRLRLDAPVTRPRACARFLYVLEIRDNSEVSI